jgi:hypothetical protein
MKEFLLVAPIHNFNSDEELIRLSDDTRIRRTQRSELQSLIEKTPTPMYHNALFSELKFTNYVIEENIKADSIYPKIEESERVGSVLVALRLLKASDVDVPFTFVLDRNEDFVVAWGGDFGIVEYSENPYSLRKEEIPSFVRLWKKHQNLTINSYLNFPLLEFMRAFETNIIEERIFHHILAFESIVFHEEDKSPEPAGKVIGMAIGMLLGNKQQERSKIKKAIEKAYQVRSALVHANLKKLRKQMPYTKQLSTKTEGYVRSALRKLLEE